MRLTIQAFGLELDVSFGIAGAEAEDDGLGRDLGYTGGTYVGFTPHDGQDIALPQRTPAWDEPEE